MKMQFVSKSSNASLTKYYPNQKMANIIEYCDSLYEIPDSWMKKLLPNKVMPIDTFISRFFLLQKNLQNLLQVQKLRSGRKKVAISDNEED